MDTQHATRLKVKIVAAALLGIIGLTSEVVAAACCESAQETAMPSLQKVLDDRASNFDATAPEDMKKTFADGLEHVKQSDAMKNAKRKGDQAPDFTLTGANGSDVTLSNLLKEGPVVVVWYRGGWCPYCNIQLRHMQNALPQLKQAGAQLVAISPEAPDKSLSTAEKNELDFFVLSDLGNQVAADYGIVFTLDDATHTIYEERLKLSEYNQDQSGALPLAVTYVIDQDGVIAWDFVNADYKRRAEPADVLDAVKALNTEAATPAS